MDKWFQMWVKHLDPMVDQIFVMQRCDPILQRFGCVPEAPAGTPVVQEGGIIEVRGYNEMGFKMSKRYLQDQGFEIVREQENVEPHPRSRLGAELRDASRRINQ